MVIYLLGSNTSIECNVIRELMALMIVQCFTAYIFTVKYNVLFSLFKFGLGLKVLASGSSS